MNRKKLIAPAIIIGMIVFMSCRNFLAAHKPFSGTLEMDEHSIGARVTGRVTELSFEEGQAVKAGELLATFERYDEAKRDYERAQKLFAVGGASDHDLENAKLAFEDQQVLSPVDGVILTKVRQKGEIAAAGSAVAVVGNNQKFWVRIYIPEGKINQVSLGQAASVKLDGVSRHFPAHVTYISTQAEFTPRNVQSEEERVTQTFAVKVTLDQPDPLLHAGVAADVRLDKK